MREEDARKGPESNMKTGYFCDTKFSSLEPADQITFCRTIAFPPQGFKVSASKYFVVVH